MTKEPHNDSSATLDPPTWGDEQPDFFYNGRVHFSWFFPAQEVAHHRSA